MDKFVKRSKNNYDKIADQFDQSLEAKLTLPFKQKICFSLDI